MENQKRVALLAGTLLLLILVQLTAINAEELGKVTDPIYKWDVGGVSFFEKMLHLIDSNQFTIVGQDRKCSDYASKTIDVAPGTGYSISGAAVCGTGYALIDVYSKLTGDSTWYPKLEFREAAEFNCLAGTNKEKCIVEIYCCPRKECATDSDCSWVGTGSKCTTRPYVPQTSDGMPKYVDVSGNTLTTYKACTDACLGNPITCWRLSGGECQSTNFNCGNNLYSNIQTFKCSGGAPTWPYNNLADCTAAKNSGSSGGGTTPTPGCVPKTCSQLGKSCGTWDNGCNQNIYCGFCSSASQTCEVGKCVTKTNPDDGAGEIPEGDTLGTTTPGTGNEGTTEQDPNVDSMNDNGPYIKVVSLTLPSDDIAAPESKSMFLAKIKNVDTVNVRKVKIEAGFYPYDYAKNTAKLFSAFPMFATVNPVVNCVGKEPFVRTIEVTMGPGETKTVYLEMEPYQAYLALPEDTYVTSQISLVPFIGVMRYPGENACCKKTANFDGCVPGTGGYIDSKYEPTFKVMDTPRLGSVPITCGGKQYGLLDYKVLGEDTVTIYEDYHKCIEYKFYTVNGSVDEEATENYKTTLGQLNFKSVKKISMTKEEISKATNTQLFASACLETSECLEKANYTVTCISIATLREEGTMTETKSGKFFADTDALLKKGVTGGSIGGAVGVVACGAIAIATSGAGAVACPAIILGGSAIGAGIGVSFTSINEEDDLIKQLKAKNDNAVGICAAEEPPFELGTFFTKIGKQISITGKPATDGMIIVVGGVLVLFLLLSLLGGKK